MAALQTESRSLLNTALLASISEHSSLGMGVFELVDDQNPDFRLLYVNDQFCRLIGADLKSGVGKLMHKAFPKLHDDDRPLPQVLLDCLQKRKPVNALEVRYGENGSEPNRYMAHCIPMDDRHVLMELNDTAKIRRMEIERERANKELQARNHDLEQLAYIASHDLKEPVRTIISHIDILSEDIRSKVDQDTLRSLQFITGAAHRMQSLIEAIFVYARLGHKVKLSRVDSGELVRLVVEDMDKLISETGTSVKVSQLPELKVYETEFRQLFRRLISNAIKFRKPNSGVKININAEHNDNHWRFYVADDGIGIDPRFHEKVFLIFQRLHTKKEYPGTGIGLANCKKIVELHGGSIWVESAPGKGSTFYFTIPEKIE